MNILGPPTISAERARNWARTRNASELFVSLVDDYWRQAPQRGEVRPEVALCQSAKETNWGRFTGQVPVSYHNVCGLKTPTAAGDRPEDHAKFPSWKQGVRAHLDHLALYAGANGYPRKPTPDPRHFPALHGTCRTVERLGGKWAPSPSYGLEVAELVTSLIGEPVNVPDFKTGWISKAGPYPIEKIACPFLGADVDLDRPRVGVIHTIEGSWSGGLSVFRTHFAPHFMIGRDNDGKPRIAQLIPLGKAAATLVNAPGGQETNGWAHVQIEMVGFSNLKPWLPTKDVQDRLAALWAQLEHDCGIPLTRPFPDTLAPGQTWATATNSRRRSGRWGKVAGWWGHVEVPEGNSHWDPGSLQYRDIFKLVTKPEPEPEPEPEPPDWQSRQFHILRKDTDTGAVAALSDMRGPLFDEARKHGWGDITLRRVRPPAKPAARKTNAT